MSARQIPRALRLDLRAAPDDFALGEIAILPKFDTVFLHRGRFRREYTLARATAMPRRRSDVCPTRIDVVARLRTSDGALDDLIWAALAARARIFVIDARSVARELIASGQAPACCRRALIRDDARDGGMPQRLAPGKRGFVWRPRFAETVQ
ncbi:MAG: hypothetical protein KAY22_07450 [Rhizorhabdus sp.]|uniref:hypothetical protein n=1 Tax=Rhizorhabdus sp. TaxID=1968843 RepID=UPI001B608FE3|nr:hypothetical protein [Rhizorhabdus sp.]MBP8232124.1 hypothetical protein [Rhizorhabdus sp.]